MTADGNFASTYPDRKGFNSPSKRWSREGRSNKQVVESAGFEAQLDWAGEKWQKEKEWGWWRVPPRFPIWEIGMETVCSDILNKDRIMGRGTGFTEKIMSCVLVEVRIRENSNSKGTKVLYSSWSVPISYGRRQKKGSEPNKKSIHNYKFLDLQWAKVYPTSCGKCKQQHLYI